MRTHGWYNKPNVRIIEARWQDVLGFLSDADSVAVKRIPPQPHTGLPGLGQFDIVYFDTSGEEYRGIVDILVNAPKLLTGPSARFSVFFTPELRWRRGYKVRFAAPETGLVLIL